MSDRKQTREGDDNAVQAGLGGAADPFLEQAGQALADGDSAAAQRAFEAAVAAAPDDPRARGGLALMAIQRQDWAAATELSLQAEQLEGAGAEIPYNLGFALLQAGDRDGAVEAFLRAYRQDPTRPEPIYQLLSLSVVPHEEGEEPGEPETLDTLIRLDLYEALARPLQEGRCLTWEHTHNWALERGAPWGPTVTWLMQQGATNDETAIQILGGRDMHLTSSRVMGMILGQKQNMLDAFTAAPPIRCIGAEAPVPEPERDSEGRLMHIATVRMDYSMARAEIPPQVAHAPMMLSLVAGILPMLGPDPALMMLVDPIEHLGPRRVWLVTPYGEVEVEGEWRGKDAHGEAPPEGTLPDSLPIPANQVRVSLPGIDSESLAAVLTGGGLTHTAGADPEGGAVVYDADGVGAVEEAWIDFLKRVAAWIPAGVTTTARWRKTGADRMAVLRRETGVRVFDLRQEWPESQVELDLPVKMEVQLLGRALFGAPRSGTRRSFPTP